MQCASRRTHVVWPCVICVAALLLTIPAAWRPALAAPQSAEAEDAEPANPPSETEEPATSASESSAGTDAETSEATVSAPEADTAETADATPQEPAAPDTASAQSDGEPAPLPDADAPMPEPADETMEAASAAETTEVETATIQGVRPGLTTRKQLHETWGQPRNIEKIVGGFRETFEGRPYHRVRVTLGESVVEAIVIQPAAPLPIATMAREMRVDHLQPVEVVNERGQLLGTAYPERGILFGFATDAEPPKVAQVVIEPVDAQLFLARAEKRLATRYGECLEDLKHAITLAPEAGRAHQLHAELTLAAGHLDQALQSARKAIELEPKQPEFPLTLAKVLAATGDYAAAIVQVREVIEATKAPPLVMAQAFAQWGDYLGASTEHDYPQALKHHSQAIKLADSLLSDERLSVRRGAKEVLLDAHLGVARDIGRGRWQHKSKVVPKWVDRAMAVADDLVNKEQASGELRWRVYEQAMAAMAFVADPGDTDEWLRALSEQGKALIAEAQDPNYKAHLDWRMGIALADAMEVEANRHNAEKATQLGEAAFEYLKLGDSAGKQWPTHDYLCGKVCYRLGAIRSIEQSNHKRAVEWFAQAVPLLEAPAPATMVDVGRHGEMFVSIAISYWEVNDRQEAVRLTSQGVRLMEQAARDGQLPKSALAIPYGNLASMHEQLGDANEAKRFQELATRYEEPSQR